MRAPRGQQGLALITAMLVVATVTTAAVYLSFGQQVWLRQVENLREAAQADAIAQGFVDVAANALALPEDEFKKAWAARPKVFTFEEGPFQGASVRVWIDDAQGRFNLNNLLREGKASAGDLRVLQRLLQAQALPAGLADSLIDWMDADDLPRPAGAEDNVYTRQAKPYRAANQRLHSVDELRLVHGFDPAAVERLRPLVTVLPQATDVNANAAPAPVLSALFPGMPANEAEQIVAEREKAPFTGKDQVLARAQGRQPDSGVEVKSRYFEVRLETRFGRVQRTAQALLVREGNGVEIIWRSANVQARRAAPQAE